MRLISINKNFSLLLVISIITSTCAEILRLAVPLIVYELNNSEVGLSVLRAVSFLPNIFFAIFIGAFNDRVIRSKALRYYLFFQSLLLLIGLFVLKGGGSITWSIYPFILSIFTLQYAVANLETGLVQASVEEKDLVKANSYLNSATSTMSLLAPVLTGLLLMYFGRSGTIATCFMLVTLSVLVASSLEVPENSVIKKKILSEVWEGLQKFSANKELVIMSIAVLFVNGSEGVYITLLIVFAKDNIGATDFEVGIVFSLAGFGALVGSIMTPTIRERIGISKAFSLPIPIVAIVYVMLAFVVDIYGLYLVSFLEGLVSSVFIISLWSFRQETTSPEFIGRVAGISGAIFKIGMPPMIIFGGFAMEKLGVYYILISIALVNFFVFILILRSRLWLYVSPVDTRLRTH